MVDGNHNSRVFNVTGLNTAFSGLTITNGAADNGAGLYNFGTIALTNITFSSNSAESTNWDGGGGMRNDGTATLTNVTFIGNSSNGNDTRGGGMDNRELNSL